MSQGFYIKREQELFLPKKNTQKQLGKKQNKKAFKEYQNDVNPSLIALIKTRIQ